jgi:hypothetical protein
MTTKTTRKLVMFSVMAFAVMAVGFNFADIHADTDIQEPTENTKASKTVADYEFVKGKISEQIQEQQVILLDSEQRENVKYNASMEVQRLLLTSQLADLKIKMIEDPDNNEKYSEEAQIILDQIDEMYGPADPSQPIPERGTIKHVTHQDTDFQGNDRTRYHCLTSSNWDANVYGDVDTHWPFGSDWNAYWFYATQATNSGSPSCDTYDNEGNWIKITGTFPFSCEHNTADDDFSDSFYCISISHSSTVTINGNAKYDEGGPVPVWWHPSHSFDVVYLN